MELLLVVLYEVQYRGIIKISWDWQLRIELSRKII